MDKYISYLADNVLSEEKTVTYRLLSRALKVHVNVAKQMLYEFHRAQNAKRPGTVHATYVIYGVKDASRAQNGNDEDVEMTSSPPYAESITEVVPSFTLSLVSEEGLKDELANFEEVKSIHVYSVAPHPTKDMCLLADVANEVLSLSTPDDKKLAPISNLYVRVRERKGPGLKASATATATKQQAKATSLKSAPAAEAKVKEEPKPQSIKTAGKSESTAEKPAPALKRGANSGIMAAFSKAAAKPKKEVKAEPAKPKEKDSPMQALSDDGEDDDEEVFKPKTRSTAGSKTKKQREEELRRMMEEDDEEAEEKSERAESPEPEPEPMEEEPVASAPVKEEKEVVESTSNGRRRGKRKIMRKKQVMDEEGYLVTIQEPGWESFSEEEEAPRPATKPKVTASEPAAKGKKGAPKGQGSIMSFFSKKT